MRCPDPAAAERDDRPDRGGAQGPGLDRRRLRAGGDRRAAGPGRAGLRQAQGRPGQGAAVAAGGDGLRVRRRLRAWPRRAAAPTTTPSSPTADGRIGTETNRHGGMLGGISSGEPIVCRVAVKPTSSLPRPQRTVTRSGEPTEIVDARPARSLPAAALRADGRGDGGAGAGRSLAALAGPVRHWPPVMAKMTGPPGSRRSVAVDGRMHHRRLSIGIAG